MKNLIVGLAFFTAFGVKAQVDGFQYPYNPDAQPDGVIGAADVVELLTFYGQAFTLEDVFFNEDSSHVLMSVGTMNFPECKYTCEHTLPGNWQMATLGDLGADWEAAQIHEAWISESEMIGFEASTNSLARAHATTTTNGSIITDLIDSQHGCFCATQGGTEISDLLITCDSSYQDPTAFDTCSAYLEAWTSVDFQNGDVDLFGPEIESCGITAITLQDTTGASFRMRLAPGTFFGQKTIVYSENDVCDGSCTPIDVYLMPEYSSPIYPNTILIYPGNAKEFIWLGDRWRSLSNPF